MKRRTGMRRAAVALPVFLSLLLMPVATRTAEVDLETDQDSPAEALEKGKATAAFHTFGADSSFVDTGDNLVSNYGTEFDAVITYKASWKQSFSLEMALYSADDTTVLPAGQDVSKLWFYTTYKF